MQFLNIFKKTDGRGSHKVRIIEDTIAEPLNEVRRHCSKGEEITVSTSEYENLIAGEKAESLEFKPSASTQARPKQTATEFTRPKVDRQEPPAELEAWPKLFAEAWRLQHEADCRTQELEQARRQCTQAGYVVVGLAALEREKGTSRVQGFVREAEERLSSFDWRRLFFTRLSAGDELLREVTELNNMIAEIREIGFRAFSERLAPLGLHRDKAEALFAGSALYQRFATISPSSAGSRCFKGDDNDPHATYSDEGLLQIFTHYRNARNRRQEIEKLLAEARKELATAKKAMRSAAA